MSKKTVQNTFFVLGVLAIIYLIYSFDLSWSMLIESMKEVGLYFPIAFVLWLFIYGINTCSWAQIVKGVSKRLISFGSLFKFTVSGFAINYITPGGLMGGEPYRILKLKSYIGTSAASSSTLIYLICHIGSHFLFWLFAIFYLLVNPLEGISRGVLLIIGTLLSLFLFVFHLLLRKGFVESLGNVVKRLPILRRNTQRVERLTANFKLIDSELSSFYLEGKQFLKALTLEFVARLIGCLEIWLLLIPFVGFSSFADSFLIVAVSSLFANMLFFLPVQLGGREGGFALAFSLLGLPAAYGVVIALLIRIRELMWIVVGVVLIKTKDSQ